MRAGTPGGSPRIDHLRAAEADDALRRRGALARLLLLATLRHGEHIGRSAICACGRSRQKRIAG